MSFTPAPSNASQRASSAPWRMMNQVGIVCRERHAERAVDHQPNRAGSGEAR
jgi:hypothetical protein